MRPRAIVFDLYGEYFRYSGGAARLGPLTELMGLFGVERATVRVVMTRLRKEGWFDSDKLGREVTYRLNEKSWHLLDDGRARIFERVFGEWNRVWTQALLDDEAIDRDRRRRIETALHWCGFGNYAGGAWFSPHDRRKQLGEMLAGGDETYVQYLQATTAGLTADRLIAERCWDLTELHVDYQDFIEQYKPRLQRYRRGIEGEQALIERMQLIQDYRRYPFRDPDLPDSLLPAGWRGREAHETFIEAHELLRAAAESLVATVTDIAAD
jgi:phenylacetic acid degradation operon negative regulatory protein